MATYVQLTCSRMMTNKKWCVLFAFAEQDLDSSSANDIRVAKLHVRLRTYATSAEATLAFAKKWDEKPLGPHCFKCQRVISGGFLADRAPVSRRHTVSLEAATPASGLGRGSLGTPAQGSNQECSKVFGMRPVDISRCVFDLFGWPHIAVSPTNHRNCCLNISWAIN